MIRVNDDLRLLSIVNETERAKTLMDRARRESNVERYKTADRWIKDCLYRHGAILHRYKLG